MPRGRSRSWECTEYTDLLQRLDERTEDIGFRSEYEDALKLLQNRLDFPLRKELWDEPVEQWLASRWNDVQEDEEYELDEDEAEESPLEEYAQLVARGFTTSPVGTGLPPELLGQAHLVAHDLVAFSLKYLHQRPREWDEAALRELLLDLVPSHTPADREQLQKFIPITEAFLYWLGAEGHLAGAEELVAEVRTWNDELVAKGMDRKNWGPVKTYLMEAKETGVNPTEERRLMELFTQQLHEIEAALPELTEPAPQAPEKPPIPIVEHSPKPARNAPCPCGSGKKYKKCHGRPGVEQTSDL